MARSGKRLPLVALILVMGGVSAPSSHGQARVSTPQVAASIIPETRSIRPGVPLRVAIRLDVAPGWHIYWTNPGESGLATTVRWTGPAGFTAGPIRWPYPERKDLGGVVVHAYEGEVILLGEIRPPGDLPQRDVEITAHVQWGVCREVCIPQKTRLSLSLPVRSGPPRPDPRWNPVAVAAGPRIPRSASQWTLRAARAQGELVLRAIGPEGGIVPSGPLTFFPDDPSMLPAAVAMVPEREGRELTVRISESSPDARVPMPARLRGVLVARSGWDAAGRVRALRVDIPIEAEGRGGTGSLPEPTKNK